MDRIVSRLVEPVLGMLRTATPSDYLWLAGGILVVGWLVSRNARPKYR